MEAIDSGPPTLAPRNLKNQRPTASVAIIRIVRTAATPRLWLLISLTRYSALETVVATEPLTVVLGEEFATLSDAVSLIRDGGTVVSKSPAVSSSRRNSFSSIATSFIVWYRSSLSFTKQRRRRRCNSAGADGLRSLICGAGS